MLLDWLDPFLGINKNSARPIGNPNNPLVPIKIHLDLIDSMGTGKRSDLEGKEVIHKIWDRMTDRQTDKVRYRVAPQLKMIYAS